MLQNISRELTSFRGGMNANSCIHARLGISPIPHMLKKLRKSPNEVIAVIPGYLTLHEINALRTQERLAKTRPAYPDCVQTGMHSNGALIPIERQRSADSDPKTDKMVPKPSLIATDEEVKENQRRTPSIYRWG